MAISSASWVLLLLKTPLCVFNKTVRLLILTSVNISPKRFTDNDTIVLPPEIHLLNPLQLRMFALTTKIFVSLQESSSHQSSKNSKGKYSERGQRQSQVSQNHCNGSHSHGPDKFWKRSNAFSRFFYFSGQFPVNKVTIGHSCESSLGFQLVPRFISFLCIGNVSVVSFLFSFKQMVFVVSCPSNVSYLEFVYSLVYNLVCNQAALW